MPPAPPGLALAPAPSATDAFANLGNAFADAGAQISALNSGVAGPPPPPGLAAAASPSDGEIKIADPPAAGAGPSVADAAAAAAAANNPATAQTLTPEVMEEFRKAEFTMGRIPEVEPPPEVR